MSTPLRMNRAGFHDLPSIDEIRRLVTPAQHLVFRFPSGPDAPSQKLAHRRTVELLARALPEFRVFESGGDLRFFWISIVHVIPEDRVLAHTESLVRAAREFRRIASDLANTLAKNLNSPVDSLLDAKIRFPLRKESWSGTLGGGWEYSFHGMECRFENARTGQVLEVCLNFGDEFGVLDPFFFHEFLRTTPGYEALVAALPNAFHDTARALDVLERRHLLRSVSSKKWCGAAALD
jgi:hypothetical protein